MAALTICITSALAELYQFVSIYMRSGYNTQETFCYLKQKKRLQLYDDYVKQYYREKLCDKEQTRQINKVYNKKMNNMKQQQQYSKQSSIGDYDVIDYSTEAIDEIFDTPSVASANEYFEMVDGGHLCKSECMDYEHIEEISALDDQTNLQEEIEEELVYHNPNLVRLQEGVSFTVSGVTKKYCERFSIDFIIENVNRDVALHINPRLPQNYIVRNCRVRSVWGPEEVASALPFNLWRGQRFAIQILFTDDCYMIGVNGFHFCKFKHRLPYRDIRTLEVKGDIEDDVVVERMRVDHYPFRLPESEPLQIHKPQSLKSFSLDPDDDDDASEDAEEKDVVKIPREWRRISLPSRATMVLMNSDETELRLPFWGTFPKGTYGMGRVLKVDGRVKLLPQSFYINIQTGTNMWPHPTIALHLNARFSKQHSGAIGRTTMIRNAWQDGAWGIEERSDIDTGFRPGKSFSLCIVHAENCFEIYVNHRFLTHFKFRISPRIIDAIYIIGDIKLWNVTLENEISFDRIRTPKLGGIRTERRLSILS